MSKKQKNQPSSVKIREQLEAKDKELYNRDDLFGMTLLTNPGLISSSRNIMFTSHLRQFVNLQNPEVPRMFTNYEDVVGEFSTSYDKAASDYTIKKRILRYNDIEHNDQSYVLFVYDEKNDHYHVLFNKKREDLTEKYGYNYNTEYLDQRQEGDTINKGDVYHKSTSYDDEMHYRYGVNARFMYAIDNRTIEDAIVVSRSLSERMVSTEMETIRISVNDNDIFCNIYGDNNEYKAFPNINEETKGDLVCALRRIHKSQLLHDLKQSNLREVDYSSDSCTYCSGKVVDITVYSNKRRDEIKDNQFNRQVLQYLDYQDAFYREILDYCEHIMRSGSNYSKEVKYWMKKAREYLDESVKWREEDNSVFSNMIIEFTIAREVKLAVGQKITGNSAPLYGDVHR